MYPSIATFEEALEYEKMYSKHRNSDSFREEQAAKRARRENPVHLSSPANNKYHRHCNSKQTLKSGKMFNLYSLTIKI